MKRKHIFIFLLFLSIQFAKAQFTLEGEFRPRIELFDNGFNYRYQPAAASPSGNTSGREGTDAYLGTSVRVALNSKYISENYVVYVGLQEVFRFGDRTQISAASNGNFRVQEAWADLKLSELWRFKLGRQPLSYDDQRILGGLGWAQQARTHDVGVLKYKKAGFGLDVGYSVNTLGDNIYDTALLFSYRNLAFAHISKKAEKFSISGLLLNTTFQNGTEDKSNLFTGGVHLNAKLGKLGLTANAYLQTGKRAGEVDVKGATLFSLTGNFKASDKVAILGGGEIISGAEDDTAPFFPLYGTNHKFNGLMDRFYVGNHAVGNGLVDFNLGASFKVGKGYNITLKGHSFSEASRDKNSLGSEIDLVIAKAFKGFKVVGGYSQFFESDDFPNPAGNLDAKGTQNWVWAMLILKPKFLNTTKAAE